MIQPLNQIEISRSTMNERPRSDTHGEVQGTAPAATATESASLPRWLSEQLLQGHREVLIEHEGTLYRLRQTRNGKLILNK